MVEPVSALGEAAAPRSVLPKGISEPGIRLSELPIRALWQLTAWPDRLTATGTAAARAAGVAKAPGPGRALEGKAAWCLRTDPLRWWAMAELPLDRPALDPADGTVLDLGHARTRLRIEGPAQAELIARLTALDLRSFEHGRVATAPIHHVSATFLARGEGVDVILMRTFARALFEHIAEIGEQFGLEIG